MTTSETVVFFDGECGLCDKTVKFLIRIDRRHRLRFATLQGETSRAEFGAEGQDRESWSVRLVDSYGRHSRSTAVLRAVSAVGGVWSLARVFLLVPRFIRDGVYRFIATNRYRWFGRFDACMIPGPALKERFLP